MDTRDLAPYSILSANFSTLRAIGDDEGDDEEEEE